MWVVDDVSGAGLHKIDRFWHPAGSVERLADGSIQLRGGMRMIVPDGCAIEIEEDGDYGWVSPVPGIKHASPVLRVSVETELPLRMAAVFDSHDDSAPLRIEKDRLTLGDRQIQL